MKNVHFIGIEGAGMSAAAQLLISSGCQISGSDLRPGEQSQKLHQQGANIFNSHQRDNLHAQLDTVVISAAITDDNCELCEARKRQLQVLKYAELLGYFTQQQKGLAIAGTHGKSTTSGMLAWMLDYAQLDPSFIVGAQIRQFSSNSRLGSGPHIVVEACEYDRSFLQLQPHAAIITNIEKDHLDYYKNFSDIIDAFTRFARLVKNFLIVESGAREKLGTGISCKIETFSVEGKADWQVSHIERSCAGSDFDVVYHGQKIGRFSTSLPGMHNIANSLATIAMGYNLQINASVLAQGINEYSGVGRRFEILREDPLVIIDDYAHHPTEIKATLEAARRYFSNARIWAIFQPHQASRTYHLLDEFSSAFLLADEIIITDIFYARDSVADRKKVTSQDLVDTIAQHGRAVRHLGEFSQVIDFFKRHWRQGDVVLTMGAGNIHEIATTLTELCAKRNSGIEHIRPLVCGVF